MNIARTLTLCHEPVRGTTKGSRGGEGVAWKRYTIEIAENLMIYKVETKECAKLSTLTTDIHIRVVEK
jgi:hypothetical protein